MKNFDSATFSEKENYLIPEPNWIDMFNRKIPHIFSWNAWLLNKFTNHLKFKFNVAFRSKLKIHFHNRFEINVDNRCCDTIDRKAKPDFRKFRSTQKITQPWLTIYQSINQRTAVKAQLRLKSLPQMRLDMRQKDTRAAALNNNIREATRVNFFHSVSSLSFSLFSPTISTHRKRNWETQTLVALYFLLLEFKAITNANVDYLLSFEVIKCLDKIIFFLSTRSVFHATSLWPRCDWIG